MTDTLTIRQNSVGVVWLFAVDLPEQEIDAFQGRGVSDNGADVWSIQDALGATYLDGDHYDLFDVADLDDLGLAGLLIDGHGIDPAEIDPMRAQLSQLSGYVLILTSGAVAEVDQTLTPKAPLRWIATFKEDLPPVNFEPLPNPDPAPAMEDAPQKKKPSDAAMGGRVATIALIVMGLLVWLMIKIAG